MHDIDDNDIQFSKGTSKNRCLSCGTSENMKRRKYCSIECRQRLRYNLNLRTGLLRALNTRYATFYFTESLIRDFLTQNNIAEIKDVVYSPEADMQQRLSEAAKHIKFTLAIIEAIWSLTQRLALCF